MSTLRSTYFSVESQGILVGLYPSVRDSRYIQNHVPHGIIRYDARRVYADTRKNYGLLERAKR